MKIWFWKKDTKEFKWKPIDTVPLNKVVLIACDSYDCGWIVDTA